MADKHVLSNDTALVIRKNDGKNEEENEKLSLYTSRTQIISILFFE